MPSSRERQLNHGWSFSMLPPRFCARAWNLKSTSSNISRCLCALRRVLCTETLYQSHISTYKYWKIAKKHCRLKQNAETAMLVRSQKHLYTTIWPRWSALRIYSALAQGFKWTWMVALGSRVNVSPKASDESCCCGITITILIILRCKRCILYRHV